MTFIYIDPQVRLQFFVVISAVQVVIISSSGCRYSLKEGDWGFFWINETTGEMWTKQTINREEHSNFTIVVLAYDNGSPALNDVCTVVINVTDVNDNAPEFDVRKCVSVNVPPQLGHLCIFIIRPSFPMFRICMVYALFTHDMCIMT